MANIAIKWAIFTTILGTTLYVFVSSCLVYFFKKKKSLLKSLSIAEDVEGHFVVHKLVCFFNILSFQNFSDNVCDPSCVPNTSQTVVCEL